jgi:signal transduction histidine kinase/CheY-like chemotaxis protein
LAIAPAWLVMYFTHLHWTGFAVGLLALGAAWFGGERFILRQVRLLLKATQQLAAGDLTSRSGLSRERGELGELARTFDEMAANLGQRVQEREQAEKTLLGRSLQQTVVGALGQFALVSTDFSALLNQVVMLVSQTLDVEYCNVLELLPDGEAMVLRAGMGWREGVVGTEIVPANPYTQAGFTLTAGEPVVVEDLASETRFHPSPFLVEHGVVSGVTVAIAGHGRAIGILGAHTGLHRKFTEDEVHFLLSVATVLAMAVERNRAEEELQKLAAFVQLNPNAAMELAEDGTVTYFNDAALKLAISVGRDQPRDILPGNVQEFVRTCVQTRQSVVRLETQIEGRTFSWAFHPVLDSHVVHCYAEDITERLSLEAQLRQSQKMESVGQLAAGVAHDFNNMLTIIQSHAGLLSARPGLPAEILDSAQAIYFAAERAASLTRQLLMFSRKNLMQPRLLDLRQAVANVSTMLQRLLGETITLEFDPPSELPLVRGDTGMIEQVLMNLVVNARDAMPIGGAVTVSITTAEIDEPYVQVHPQARVGTFVCLHVTDTGRGMDAATMSRIFEPFFTTKEVGKGTGLGLATVYGIVKQHEGWIEVASQVGQGSTFSVFFPAGTEPVKAKAPEPAPVPKVRGGKETILVVEDEPALRTLANTVLQECGYQVLEAASGAQALQVWNGHAGPIDLLLTDLVMPEGVSGVDLAQRLLATRPELKIIFASGYNMGELDTDFIRKAQAVFLQKPYTHVTLTNAVRDCLDRRET